MPQPSRPAQVSDSTGICLRRLASAPGIITRNQGLYDLVLWLTKGAEAKDLLQYLGWVVIKGEV